MGGRAPSSQGPKVLNHFRGRTTRTGEASPPRTLVYPTPHVICQAGARGSFLSPDETLKAVFQNHRGASSALSLEA